MGRLGEGRLPPPWAFSFPMKNRVLKQCFFIGIFEEAFKGLIRPLKGLIRPFTLKYVHLWAAFTRPDYPRNIWLPFGSLPWRWLSFGLAPAGLGLSLSWLLGFLPLVITGYFIAI